MGRSLAEMIRALDAEVFRYAPVRRGALRGATDFSQPYGDIYVMRADGSDVRMLTENEYEEGTPTWLPLGSQQRHK